MESAVASGSDLKCELFGKEYQSRTWLEKHKQSKHPQLKPKLPNAPAGEDSIDARQSEDEEEETSREDQADMGSRSRVSCPTCGKLCLPAGLAVHIGRVHKSAVADSELPLVVFSSVEGDVNSTSLVT